MNTIYGFGVLLLVIALWSATTPSGSLGIFTAIGGALSTRLEILIGVCPILVPVSGQEIFSPT
jgi:hypothetical protein